MKRLGLVLVLAGCDDALDQRLAIITEPRVLAVIAEPAEATPKTPTRYTLIAASPDGPLAPHARFAFCTAPKPPTEDNAVADGCLDDANLIDITSGAADEPTIGDGPIPDAACLNDGPDTPPGGFRPRDADSTGGYYQPVAVTFDDLRAFGLSRIICNLPTAPGDLAQRYRTEYVANVNPTLDPAQTLALDRVPANGDVSLTAGWPAEAVETYLYFDPLAQVLVVRREAMRVSWFATAGAIDVDASVVDEADPQTSVSTTWHTPGPGTADVWAVLRDSRGGIAVTARRVTVE